MSDIFRQEAGLEHLGLADIDPRLDFDGKSVERISDPEFRLVVLWTCIGQYAAAAMNERVETGDDFPTVNDARHQQLIARWAMEARRVYPDIRTMGLPCDREQRILGLLDENKPLAAYLGIIDLRSQNPEFMHPDVRFDLMATMYEWSNDLSPGDSFKPMLLADMIDETRPGGIGYCDETERLRRYWCLMDWDDSLAGVVSDYIVACKSTGQEHDTNYFDGLQDMNDILQAVVERRHIGLANHLVRSGLLSLEEEAELLPVL